MNSRTLAARHLVCDSHLQACLMDAVEKENTQRQRRWYVAPIYLLLEMLKGVQQDQGRQSRRGYLRCCLQRCVACAHRLRSLLYNTTTGREADTGRRIAIKKIKVGQFKDGLDMSAIREVKYLRELRHQNVIEVRVPSQPCFAITL